jgi:Tol biopolymer transport system component
MNPDGTGRFPIGVFPGMSNPDFAPSGSALIFEVSSSIWTYNRATGTALRLTLTTGDSRAHYSPDGTKIVFQSTRDGQAEIYVMNSDGSGQTRLTENSAADTAPSWSPDGTRILFTSLRDGPMSPALYVMTADGKNQTRVTAGTDGAWRRTVSTTPVVFTEGGSTNVAAVNSVTFLRGPFRIHDVNNFSVDGHTRIVLFTSNLGVVSPPIPPTSTLSVKANGVELPVEKVGQMPGITGQFESYIVVRLPDGLPNGNLSLTVTMNGVTSAPTILSIVP